MKNILRLTLNGRLREDLVPDNMLLLDYLREAVGLTGTKQGCDGGGAAPATVLVDDRPASPVPPWPTRSPAGRSRPSSRLSTHGTLSKLQAAFHEKLGTQCGFCTPGMLMAFRPCCARTPIPSREEIKTALAGNLCRCTGYVKIIESVEAAAAARLCAEEAK